MVRTKVVKEDLHRWRVDLQEEIIDRAGRELQRDIDFEIITDLLCNGKNAWTKVVLQPMTIETSDAVDLWLLKNCKGKYNTRGLVWVFENAKDAMWFKLRWLGSD